MRMIIKKMIRLYTEDQIFTYARIIFNVVNKAQPSILLA